MRSGTPELCSGPFCLAYNAHTCTSVYLAFVHYCQPCMSSSSIPPTMFFTLQCRVVTSLSGAKCTRASLKRQESTDMLPEEKRSRDACAGASPAWVKITLRNRSFNFQCLFCQPAIFCFCFCSIPPPPCVASVSGIQSYNSTGCVGMTTVIVNVNSMIVLKFSRS